MAYIFYLYNHFNNIVFLNRKSKITANFFLGFIIMMIATLSANIIKKYNNAFLPGLITGVSVILIAYFLIYKYHEKRFNSIKKTKRGIRRD
ncbi:hypothetical protein [Thermosyntropha sp.]|uniref:hypothetical protein n=1 Tax=Thermosyntropha sp. TaxID=2740820 RepID=UPI0025DB01D9|nr:hypothetical protein [Thermosyntropha sp.]MBO8158210.1 hypothetical protein [Thermosyntropha sp.]